MSNLKQLEEKLQINEHALDVALREHPDLFYQVASQLALSISKRDADKQALGEAEASVAMELRAKAARLDEKVTENSIAAQVKSDKRIVEANEAYLNAHFEAAKWAALKEAYESRSYALSKLVDLFIANYYSSNEGSKTGATAFRETQANHIKDHNKRKRVEV
jgi:hypothetical protein